MTGLPTKALFVVLALAGTLAATGCEVVAGIKHRPLAGGSGGGGTGGSPAGTGGTGGRGGAGGSTGGAGSPAIGQVGTPCSAALARACQGNNSTQKLQCNGQEWIGNGECSPGERCDTRPGPTAGMCVAIVPECAQAPPRDLVCVGNAVHRCGDDSVTTDLVTACSTAAAPDCSAAACTCTGTMCGPACVHLDSDSNNCGACDKACPGTCSGGRCRPIVVAQGQGTITGLALDAANIYWANGAIMKKGLAGSDARSRSRPRRAR